MVFFFILNKSDPSQFNEMDHIRGFFYFGKSLNDLTLSSLLKPWFFPLFL